ncbi:hypothetical protein WCD74_01150 [Actinomycetospora sp. OC33-EN08]|uniref:Uncharacterized protein n=1 Tax=Actinomycetospora aurantiaca TaxID=3129233 RepID=A0ABU8MG90_9PSEU
MINAEPAAADNIIAFGGSGPDPHAAKLDYSVPLPGQLTNRRVVELRGLARLDEYQTPDTSDIPLQIGGSWSDGRYIFRPAAAVKVWLDTAAANGVRGDLTAELSRFLLSGARDVTPAGGSAPVRVPPQVARTVLDVARSNVATHGGEGGLPFGAVVDLSGDPDNGSITVPELFPLVASFLSTLFSTGVFEIPSAEIGGGVVVAPMLLERDPAEPVADPDPPQPRIFLVEEWMLSSFLGDYGLGRTVKTMTLLPGEQLTMRLRTWRSSERSERESASIFDSNSREAQQRFSTEVERETTDKRSKTKTEEWHAEAKVGASWGFGSAEVSGGGSGKYHSARDQFAKQVNSAAQEHARSESSKRENTITSSTEVTEKREDEESTERVIRNVNLRHTLNFVFRELNQQYLTYLHLTNVKIGFTNGTVNSWREVPVAQLRDLLDEVLLPEAVERVANAILKVAYRTFDVDGNPVTVLERRDWDPENDSWSEPVLATSVGGVVTAPSDVVHYRFRKGFLGAVDGEPNTRVPGVVLVHDSVTMTTDSVVGEALLGQADALDVYAMATQAADASAKTLANERDELVNEALRKLPDAEKVDAYIRMLAARRPSAPGATTPGVER